MIHHNDHTRSHARHGKTILTIGAAMIGGGVLALWGWNTVAADLLGGPEARFVHALAAQSAVIGLSLPLLVLHKVRGES